jgi:hypothetical protein
MTAVFDIDLTRFLAPSDSSRAFRTFQNFSPHDLSHFALTGGLAIEMHIAARRGRTLIRPLNDIDFLVASFEQIPMSLGANLLLRHVHPHDPPGRTLLQAVDPQTSVRLDVFRAYTSDIKRSQPAEIHGICIPVVNFEDLLARHARLCMDLVEVKTLVPKYARDFLRMPECATAETLQGAEEVWPEHRKPAFPLAFSEAARQIRRAVEGRSDLLVQPRYFTDVQEVCSRCHSTAAFPLASAEEILAHLGYC